MSQDSQSQPQDSDLESPSDSTQCENPQGAPNKLLACYAWLPKSLRKPLSWMSDNINIESNWGRGLYIAAYMIVILMHPLHYYAYEINFDQNCLEIVNELNATIAAVVFFNFYMLLYTPNCLKNTFSSNHDSKTAIGHFFFIQIPVLFMTLTVLPYLTTGAKDQIFLAAADLFLFGYILLVIGLSLTIKRATEINGFFAEAKWVKAVFNLFLYLLGGHVFGALWYSFAIDKILECWREDYFLRKNSKPDSFLCRDLHKNKEHVRCPKITQNVSKITAFGVFNEAIKSGIVERKPQFLRKILYCFRWGMQALSCFGQNLTPTTDYMENICVVSVVIYSTVLFVFLIGNMQTYLTSEEKSVKQTVKQWMSLNKLPEKLQKEVIKNLQLDKWQETKILHIETFFNVLPEKLHRDIKIELCLPRLKKVKEFPNWERRTLMELCYRMKPTFYVDGTLVVREGDPISEILFLLNGELWTYTSRATDHCNNDKDHLVDDDFFGKELVTWVQGLQADSYTSRLPASTKTVKALKNVEAFLLTAYDLKEIFIEHK